MDLCLSRERRLQWQGAAFIPVFAQKKDLSSCLNVHGGFDLLCVFQCVL